MEKDFYHREEVLISLGMMEHHGKTETEKHGSHAVWFMYIGDRIFERFYRVDKSHSKERGGTGLGLSIVKHGAILHGAKVQVDSEYGKGTRMEIIFPEK